MYLYIANSMHDFVYRQYNFFQKYLSRSVKCMKIYINPVIKVFDIDVLYCAQSYFLLKQLINMW